MSEHENEDSSSESEVSENPDPQIKVGEQILQTIQAIRECKTKKLKLLTSLEAGNFENIYLIQKSKKKLFLKL